MFSYFKNLGGYLLSGFIGAVIALALDRCRNPRLLISVGEEANDDNTYSKPNLHAGERWKFSRAMVTNQGVKMPFSLVTVRETAQNCSAQISFYRYGRKKPLFSMKGRWASTPEIPHIGRDALVKILHPDPVTIPASKSEFLDIITQMDGEKCAYAWNAESYLHNWRHPSRKLNPGVYGVNIIIHTQNAISFSANFKLKVSKNIEQTSLVKDK